MKTIPLLLAGFSGLAIASESPAAENPPKGLTSSDWSSIRAAYEAGRHAVHRQENGTLTARNPGQQWRTDFDGKGFTVTPDSSSVSFQTASGGTALTYGGLKAWDADGTNFVSLAFDTTPNYEDSTPYPATPTKWTYKAIYRVDDHQVGQWSAEVSVTVGV